MEMSRQLRCNMSRSLRFPNTRCTWPPIVIKVLLATLALSGCSSRVADEEPSVDQENVVVEFPQGDSSVPAKLGGPGFAPDEASGWKTNTSFPFEGSPDAVKGGAIRYWVRFPPTLRTVGKDSTTGAASILKDLCYESLLDRHPNTLNFIPRLATHWWISDDRRVYRYRINPRAHWSDGKPVVAGDVIATWDLLTDVTILQPTMQIVYGRFERPTALSKYIVEVRARELSWRNFIYFSTMKILPAHQLQGMEGTGFRRKYQFHMIAGSGPYRVRDADVVKGRRITLRRRKDYWGWDERFATGLFNFDLIRLTSTEDSVLAMEKAKKGEIDIFKVGKAKDWAVDLPRLDQVKRGLLVMCQVQNDEPQGASGIVMNMRHPPLSDVRIRDALCHLYNRKKLIEKLFYNEYVPLNSYFPGGEFENRNNFPVRYDPEKAERLLAAAGWKHRDSQGMLVKDGQRLGLTLIYSSKLVERYLSIFQEDCQKAGIQIYLKQLTRASRFQTTYGNRSFQMATQGWSGSLDPNPETYWSSGLADKPNNHNYAGLQDERVDQLCKRYSATFDAKARIQLLQELDQRLLQLHPCILGWTSPYIRLLFWNRFGQPPWYVGRTVGVESVLKTWWVDAAKDRALRQAKQHGASLKPGPGGVHYWSNLRHAAGPRNATSHAANVVNSTSHANPVRRN